MSDCSSWEESLRGTAVSIHTFDQNHMWHIHATHHSPSDLQISSDEVVVQPHKTIFDSLFASPFSPSNFFPPFPLCVHLSNVYTPRSFSGVVILWLLLLGLSFCDLFVFLVGCNFVTFFGFHAVTFFWAQKATDCKPVNAQGCSAPSRWNSEWLLSEMRRYSCCRWTALYEVVCTRPLLPVC